MNTADFPIASVIRQPDDMAPYLVDWRGQDQGRARLVALPRSVQEVVQVVDWCRERRVPIVPQGGNTSLVGGSVPDASGASVVLSLRKLAAIRSIDADNNLVVAEAGAILQTVQAAAQAVNRMFPLSLAAEGSCTIGGNLSTNAGGTAVLQYGNARELCLGLEVVTPDGQVLSDLKGLRKDNTGLNLRNLFIGAEGTLGIITAAALRLFPRPVAQVTSFAALADAGQAVALLGMAHEMLGSGLTAFELMSRSCVEAVHARFADVSRVFEATPAYQLLVELSDQESETHANERLLALMERALDAGVIEDAAIAASLAQSRAFWTLRERVAEAQKSNFKHDITLPVARIPRFLEDAQRSVLARYPDSELIVVGHVGDGNLHFNVSPPPATDASGAALAKRAIEEMVYALVDQHEGSISAEHGIGRHKVDSLRKHKAQPLLALMKSIKSTIDPHDIMNPGVIF